MNIDVISADGLAVPSSTQTGFRKRVSRRDGTRGRQIGRDQRVVANALREGLIRAETLQQQQQAFAAMRTIVATGWRTVGFSSRSGNMGVAEHGSVALVTGDQEFALDPGA